MALGPFCKAVDIDEDLLLGQKTKIIETKSVSNGLMWELRKFKTAKKLSNKDLVDWMINIFQVKCENNETIQEELNKKLETLANIRKYLSKASAKYRGEVDRLMNWNFDFPAEMGMDPVEPFEPTVCASLGPKLLKVLKEKGGDDEDSMDVGGQSDEDDEEAKKRKAREEIVHLKRDLGLSKKVITALNDKMLDLSKRCQLLSDFSKASIGISERKRIERDAINLKIDWSNAMVNWHDCIERLNHVNNNKRNYLDVGYMVRRNKTKQGIFDELNYEFEKTLEEFKQRINKTNALIDKEKKKKKVVVRQKGKTDKKRTRLENEEPEEVKKPRLSEEVSKTEDKTSKTEDKVIKTEETLTKNEDSSVKTEETHIKTEEAQSKTDEVATKIEDAPTKMDVTPSIDGCVTSSENVNNATDSSSVAEVTSANQTSEAVNQTSEPVPTAAPAEVPSTPMTLEEFMNSEKLDEFKNGKFINALRAVFYELSNMPIPCKDVHEVIFTILDELETLNIDKLPSASFGGNILMECHMAAALQAVTEILKASKVSIGNDGITKFSFTGTSYDVTLPDGARVNLGIQDITDGSPDTSWTVLKDIINDITSSKTEGPAETIRKTLSVLASDHKFLDKKLIEILFLYKQRVAPLIAGNFEALSDTFRSKVLLLNNFCTGLYFLLGLAKLTDATAFAWEGMSFGNNVACPKELDLDILSKSLRQAHSFCDKISSDSTDEAGESFREFVLNEKSLDSFPFAPHKDNIFNITFHNSAGIWFYHEIGVLTEFFEKMKAKESNVDSIASLLNEKHCFAFARALGLLGKLVAVPMWTVLMDDAIEIGSRYKLLLKNVENWAKDSSKFMKGQERLFEDVPGSYDAVYISLIKDNEPSNILTKELLELMFTAYASYIKFFLYGTISQEKVNGETPMEMDDCQVLLHEDFSSFDKITLNIHSTATFALEALTLYSKTRNGAWQDKLCNKENMKVVEFIGKDYNKQLNLLYKRKIKISDLCGHGLNKNDSYKLIEKKYSLIDDIVKFGGLWKSEKEVDAQIKAIGEKDRLKAYQTQILYRKYVLGESHDNGLLDLASEGKFFDSSKLQENLKTILKKEAESVDVFQLATATDDEQKKEKVIESCKNAHELSPREDTCQSMPKENLSDLLGKLVSHLFPSEQGKEFVTGVCIGRRNLNGFCSYYIRYKNKGVYSVPGNKVAEDLESHNLKVIDPAVKDLIGAELSRAFIKDDGELEWHDCKAVGVTNHGSDFIVEFDIYGGNLKVEDEETLPKIETLTFATKLVEEYRTGHLRLL